MTKEVSSMKKEEKALITELFERIQRNGRPLKESDITNEEARILNKVRNRDKKEFTRIATEICRELNKV